MGTPIIVRELYEVAEGYETDFYSWGTALIGVAEQAYGYLGGHIRDPEYADGEWQIVHRWADRDDAWAWEVSDIRARWLTAAEAFVRPLQSRARPARATFTPYLPADEQISRRHEPSGGRAMPEAVRGEPAQRSEATWDGDGPPAVPAPVPAPKWKSAVVTLLAVFPPVLIFNVTVIPRLAGLSVLLRTLVLCIGVTIVVTWVMMPRLQRLFRPWLQGGPGRAPTGPASYDAPGMRAEAGYETPVNEFPVFRPAAARADSRSDWVRA